MMTEAKRYDVFLSHNSDDKPLVEELALRLQDEAGLNPWLDAWHIPAGDLWKAEIEQALGSCKTCAVILGEHGWGKYHLREAKAALARQREHSAYRVIPVFLPGAREEDTKELPEFFAKTQWVDFRKGLEDPDALARLIAAIPGEAPYPEGRAGLSYLIRRDARRWEQARRGDESLLYRGDQLSRAQQWADQHPKEVTPLAQDFLQAGFELEKRERRRRRQLLVKTAVGLLVLLVVLLYGWSFFSYYLSASNSSTIVVQAGHPGLKVLPGFDYPIVVTDYSLRDLKNPTLVSDERLSGLRLQRSNGYAYWGEQLFNHLKDPIAGLAYWRAGDSEQAFDRLAQGVNAGDVESVKVLGYLALQSEAAVAPAIDTLIVALQGDDELHEAAVTALAVVRDTQPDAVATQLESLTARLRMASQADAVAIAEAISILGAHDQTASLPVSTTLLDVLYTSDDAGAELATARSLASILTRNPGLSPKIMPDIIELVSQSQGEVRQALIGILGIPSELDPSTRNQALQTTARALDDEDPMTRIAAVNTLGHLISSAPSPSPAYLPALLAMAEDRNSGVRDAVTEALASLPPDLASQRTVLETLMSFVRDDEHYDVRYNAIRGLARMRDSESMPAIVETLVAATGDANDLARWGAVHALVEIGMDRAAEAEQIELALRAALDDNSPGVRQEAAQGLLLLADQVGGDLTPALDEFILALTFEDWRQVEDAERLAQRFAEVPPEAAALVATELSPYAIQADDFATSKIIRFLKAIGENQPKALPGVVLALADLLESDRTAGEANSSLWFLRTQSTTTLAPALESLFERLNSPSPAERETAAHAIGWLLMENRDLAPKAAAELTLRFSDPDPRVRAEVVLSLGLIGRGQTEAVQPVLEAPLDCLSSEQPLVRAACANALADISESERPPVVIVTPPLITALRDSDPEVRQAAAIALSNLAKKAPELVQQAATEPLRALLQDEPDPKTRLVFASALGIIGGQDSEISSEVITIAEAGLKESDADMRQQAIQVLRDLGKHQPLAADLTIETLEPILKDPEGQLRLQAILAIRDIGRSDASNAEAALAALEQALFHPDGQTRWDAIANGIDPIVRFQPTSAARAISLLRDFLDDEPASDDQDSSWIARSQAWETLTTAYTTLASDKPEILWPLLTSSRSSERDAGRKALMLIVTQHPDLLPKVMAKLEKLRQDPQPHVRQSAALAEEMIAIAQHTERYLSHSTEATRWSEVLDWLPAVGVDAAREFAQDKIRELDLGP